MGMNHKSQIESLNLRYAIKGHLEFQVGENGLPVARVNNALAKADIYLQGGHVTLFQPRGHEPVLWMSSRAQFEHGKAIRGGVPVIWPWFGPHATDSNKPQHGFARTAEWTVKNTTVVNGGDTQLQLLLGDSPSTRALWPHVFELTLTITIGKALTIELTSLNTGRGRFIAGAALHSYFAISEVSQMHVEGLAGRDYIDQLDGNQIKHQADVVRVDQEVDRIYINSEDTCVIHDEVTSRRILVQKSGSRSTVVWNPWTDKARAMADFDDEGYQHMLCIETANAADDVRELAAGEKHTLCQFISVSNRK